jgi:hypothetical protein
MSTVSTQIDTRGGIVFSGRNGVPISNTRLSSTRELPNVQNECYLQDMILNVQSRGLPAHYSSVETIHLSSRNNTSIKKFSIPSTPSRHFLFVFFPRQHTTARTSIMAHLHSHDGGPSHSHDQPAADHGHTHEILNGPGSYMGREPPIIEGRNWSERAFTVGIGG